MRTACSNDELAPMSCEFSNYDIAILSCIRTWSKSTVVEELRALIAFMDYYDHSVLTFSEFSSSVNKLLQYGILTQNEKSFGLSKEYTTWFGKKYHSKKVTLQRELRDTKEFIEKTFSSKEPLNNISLFILPHEFDAAVKLYVSK